MAGLIKTWILTIIMACGSFTAWAYGDDDELKKSTKKNGQIKFENKDPKKLITHRKEDTLIFEKSSDDTLTFGDEKTADDTLIFADDEIQAPIKPKNNSGDQGYSIIQKKDISVALNPFIYPNPSFGQSTLEMNVADNANTEITITSLSGTFIKKEIIIGKKYELKDLATGIYIITIRNDSQVIQKRLFVK